MCTTIFKAFQTSEQAAFPRKHITQSLPTPSCSASQCPKDQPFVYDNKAGSWQRTVMSWECEVINPSRGRTGWSGHNGFQASPGLAGAVARYVFLIPSGSFLFLFSVFFSFSLFFFNPPPN